jgi:hypothetical protein
MVIDMTKASTDDRVQAQLWLRRSPLPSNQDWTITEMNAAVGPVFQIKNVHSGKCLTKSQDAVDGDGNVVYQLPCHYFGTNQDVGNSTDDQLWDFSWTGNGNWGQLQNRSDHRCLDVRGVSYTNGAPLQVWTCTGAWNQQWNPF